MAPLLSIITVVKDAPGDFAATLASVTSQDLSDVEYVVVDSSTDREVIPDLIAGVAVEYRWVPPSGIYHAMNTGLKAAQGDYVLFLNAGDTLGEASIFAEIKSILGTQAPVWLYAEVQMSDASGATVQTPPWITELSNTCYLVEGTSRAIKVLSLGATPCSHSVASIPAMRSSPTTWPS